MSRRAKNANGKAAKPARRASRPGIDVGGRDGLPANYWKACELIRDGQYEKARTLYAQLEQSAAYASPQVRALIQNDLAVFAALDEKFDEPCEGWRAALKSDPECMSARLNLDMVQADLSLLAPTLNVPPLHASPAPESDGPLATENPDSDVRDPNPSPRGPTRIAVLSLLFNWPSTGGGNMHTAGLVEFLSRAGYDVRHFYAQYPAWGIGRVKEDEYLGGGEAETSGQEPGGVGDPHPGRTARQRGSRIRPG